MQDIRGMTPERFFALAGRPVVQLRTPEGGRSVMMQDLATGAFLPNHALFHRLREGSADLDELDESAFLAVARPIRDKAVAACLATPIAWTRTGDRYFPYAAEYLGRRLVLRLNDHPSEPLFSLMTEEQNLASLEEWPAIWLGH